LTPALPKDFGSLGPPAASRDGLFSLLKTKPRDIVFSPFFSAAAMSEQRAGVQNAIHDHMTKLRRKLLPTQAALKNGLDAISRKIAPE
jgi:hypothetical protein